MKIFNNKINFLGFSLVWCVSSLIIPFLILSELTELDLFWVIIISIYIYLMDVMQTINTSYLDDKIDKLKKEINKKFYEQIFCKESNPEKSGWYDTDGGNLYWFKDEEEWSCRDDRVSEEYPTWWLKSV